MVVSCTQENLAKGLSIVGRSVGTRLTLPVLGNILLKTEKGGLKLSATDLEVGIHTWIGAKVDQEGSITVPAKLLIDYVNTNPDKKIDLHLKELTLHLESEHSKANIKGIDATEFPLIPEVKKKEALEIAASTFKLAVNKTLISVALDESRPVLAGVFLYGKASTLKMAATDSYRLSEQQIPLNKKIENEVCLVIPQRPMAEILRIIDESLENILIYPGENQIEFVIGSTVLVSRIIEGSFPDYQQIIPKESKTKIEVSSSELSGALKMASLFARESANNIKIKTGKDKISVIAVSPHLGDNVSEVNGAVTGDEVEIAFNAKFILDVLNVISSDKIKLQLNGNMAAGLITADKAPNFLYVIMPLRTEE